MARWMTTGQVARMLEVTPLTVRRWIAAGVLDAIRPRAREGGLKHGRYRIPRESVEAFLSSHVKRYGSNGTNG